MNDQSENVFLCVVSHGAVENDDKSPEENQLQSNASYFCCSSMDSSRKGWLLRSVLMNIQDPFKEMLRFQVYSLSGYQIAFHGKPILQTSMRVSEFLDRHVVHRNFIRRHVVVESDGLCLELTAEIRTDLQEQSDRQDMPMAVPMAVPCSSGKDETDWLVVVLEDLQFEEEMDSSTLACTILVENASGSCIAKIDDAQWNGAKVVVAHIGFQRNDAELYQKNPFLISIPSDIRYL